MDIKSQLVIYITEILDNSDRKRQKYFAMTDINRRKFSRGALATGGVVTSRIVLPVPLAVWAKTRVDSVVEAATVRHTAAGSSPKAAHTTYSSIARS
jgi:hypothetical protein